MENELNHASLKNTCKYLGIPYHEEMDEHFKEKM